MESRREQHVGVDFGTDPPLVYVDELHHHTTEELIEGWEKAMDAQLKRQWREGGILTKVSLLALRFAQWCKRRARGRA